ncbi:MAG: DNA replication/repair protein RecF [Verrucomicrobia bacterium]|nr:DNA replication/repair protein RecF [Verrucomicrobiota bacterium]
MHLAHLRLRDFRNYRWLDVDFQPGLHLLMGNNAQGKTNLLEAVYLLATLRSFRGVGNAQMVRHGEKGFFVGARIVGQHEHDIKMYWSAQERKLSLDGQAVSKVGDYYGTFRAVVFCTEDLQLVKGPGSRRRRFMDLLLAQTHPTYLPLLQRYVRALRSRNALLKQRSSDEATLESFTREIINVGQRLICLRHELMPRLSPLVNSAYRRIAGGHEELRVEYDPAVKQDFAVELARSRPREQLYRSTLIGPHRDELRLMVADQSAAQFASEGQKRSVAIAMKIAQAEYLTELHGTPPILLVDDIMGELDVNRRNAFLPLLHLAHQSRSQVFMTATEENWSPGQGAGLARWEVRDGSLRPS